VRGARSQRCALSIAAAAVLALVVVAPFEVPLRRSVFALTITSVEAVAAVTILVSAAAFLYARRPMVWRTPLTAPVAACLAIVFVSALFSPVDPANSLRFAGRMFAAAAIAVVVLNVTTTRARARRLVATLVAVAVVVALVALMEVAQVGAIAAALTLFRPGFHVVGGQLRATSTLLYPTVTSMYLEVAFALGLWLLVDRGRGASRRQAVAAFVALSLVGAGIVATFTRAGLLGMAAALASIGVLLYAKRRRVDATHARLAGLAAVLAVLILASRSPEVLVARLSTEGSQAWYGATYSAPASLTFSTGAEYHVPVIVANAGRVVWDSSSAPMFAMSYHWLRADTGAVVEFEGWRTPFAAPVPPGARVTVPVAVRAPGTAGRYVLVWDVVHEHRAWLSTEGVVPARSLVDVTGPPVSPVTSSMVRLPSANRRADRLTLWRAAVAIVGDKPVLGIGPDNFRKEYGRYIGQPGADARVHANNMYLEVLAGGGVLGLAAVAWLMAASGAALARRWWRQSRQAAPATAALAAAWLVIAGHGLVDSFLSFTTTYTLFAVTAGLAFSAGMSDADSV
jgi:hypothetical protein